MTEALLALEDGTVFQGHSIGYQGASAGEVIFNTALTGYQEILTDPSYCQQIVTLTMPHVGNTGINRADFESRGIFAAGLIVRHYTEEVRHWRSEQTLSECLRQRQIPAIAGIDTRQLTHHLRRQGVLKGCLVTGGLLSSDEAVINARNFSGLAGADLARQVTVDQSYEWRQGNWCLLKNDFSSPDTFDYHVVAMDFGVKHSILRCLVDVGCRVTVVPATVSAQDILALQPSGVFLSNGPGDPEPCDYAINAISGLLEQGMPLFGICLGHQLLALACGAATEKMKFGHHGANHPVQDLSSGRVLISSQNHGFAVNEKSLPDCLQITHRSLFDHTIQGLRHCHYPAFSFQGHPEAGPGPHDVLPLFNQFAAAMKNHRRK